MSKTLIKDFKKCVTGNIHWDSIDAICRRLYVLGWRKKKLTKACRKLTPQKE